jgi:Omp85 superfamily domain
LTNEGRDLSTDEGLAASRTADLVEGVTSPRWRLPLTLALVMLSCPGVTWAGLLDSHWLDLDRWPFIPIPEVATDPNSGTTYGFLPVFLLSDANREVRHVFAPDVNDNSTLGPGGFFRLFNYPSDDTEWYVVAGASEHVAREVDLDYADGLSRNNGFFLEGRFYFEHDPSSRYFGSGNDSHYSDQSNYTLEQLFGDGLLGFRPTRTVAIVLEERPRYVRIRRGVFTDVPYTGDSFPTLDGLDGGTEWLHRLLLAYDTRDSINLPLRGTLLVAFAGFTEKILGSSDSHVEFGVEARRYLPLGERFTLAAHLHLRYRTANSGNPFWALSSLGGEASGDSSALGLPLGRGQTWRGGGAGRFVDRNLFVANLELRTRLFGLDASGTHIELEVAPFLDVGRVFPRLDANPIVVDDLHPAGGMGFRALVLPFVVGYVDVGYAADGFAFFSGINYPF